MDRAHTLVLVRIDTVGHEWESGRLGVVLVHVGLVLHQDAVLVDGRERCRVVLQGDGYCASVSVAGDWSVDWGREIWELLLLRLRNHRLLQNTQRKNTSKNQKK